ncbi:hypothetical protein J1N35_040467 [Gossypium stocksii]|uniref:Reverse transcriptase domain-containing protein n=1 Tax=Gossypium stocksii TaxID=47602 RepID=A0A9D3UE91_9ROSI|nr:hypothetical protein J1N35_040467 [Gossypium stocksii]
MQLSWNGQLSNLFSPSRVIRQGDPLPLYLFVLCMERLAQVIALEVNGGRWKPIKSSREGPMIIYLFFFADDLILFAEVLMGQMGVVNSIPYRFYVNLGHRLNRDKTQVFFSKNVSTMMVMNLSNGLRFQRVDDLESEDVVSCGNDHIGEVCSSSYSDIYNDNRMTTNFLWKLVWRFKGPQKVSLPMVLVQLSGRIVVFDGSSVVTVEGVARDRVGQWLGGFSRKVGVCPVFEVELWGPLRAII